MNIKELRNFAENEINYIDAKVSLLVYDFSNNKTILSVNPEQKVVSASTIKVPIMLTALQKVRYGSLKTDQRINVAGIEILEDTEVFERGEHGYSLDELLKWMIINSDNTATNVLIDLLSMEAVNSYCAELSLKSTHLERKMLDFDAIKEGRNNYTSASDLFTLFSNLYHKTLLPPDLCRYAYKVLNMQRDYSSALRYIADENMTAAHKTGGLDNLSHDVGIFSIPNHDYYFGCFVWDAVDHTEENPIAKRLIGRLSRAVYDYFSED
jgi:beta-lactamase class A